MISEPRDNDTGATLSEVIAQIPNELSYDVVGLWHIVPVGQGNFGLKGEAWADFLRRAILALLDAGAVPVRHEPGTGYEWIRQKQYGSSHPEIADAIIQEWRSVPDNSIAQIEHCPWFARPIPENPNYVRMD